MNELEGMKISESIHDDIDNLMTKWEAQEYPPHLALYVALSSITKSIYDSAKNVEDAETLIEKSLSFSRAWKKSEG